MKLTLHKHRRRLASIVGSVVVLGCFSLFLWRGFPPPADIAEEKESNPEQEALKGAIELIQMASQGAEHAASSPAPVTLREEAHADASAGLLKSTDSAATPDLPYDSSHVRSTAVLRKARLDTPPEERGAHVLDSDWSIPDSALAIGDLVRQAEIAQRDWSFGWLLLENLRSLSDHKNALSKIGVEVVGTAGAFARAKLPGREDSLVAVSNLPFVRGMGTVPVDRKVSPSLMSSLATKPSNEIIPVFVTLMEGDPQGNYKTELQNLGATVADFDPGVRAYPANVPSGKILEIAAADFVLAVEPVLAVSAQHATAVPAMGADRSRTYMELPGHYEGLGGVSIPVAVLDSGLNINHVDIATGRTAICGKSFVSFENDWDGYDLWHDAYGHGTHVTGTIAGRGVANPFRAGMAPLISRIRIGQVLDSTGWGSALAVMRGMDYAAASDPCDEGKPGEPSIPLIVNMSLAASSRYFDGTGVESRKLDHLVWSHGQLYVVANSNEGFYGYSNFASAKNSLSVGAVYDSGEVVAFSSRGPTYDGRLIPNVVGTGVNLYSATAFGTRAGYVEHSGTSMASPSVAGVAALLLEAYPDLQGQPAAARASLMSSAIVPDGWLDDPELFPLDNTNGPGQKQRSYGMGKVSAITAVHALDEENGWTGGHAIVDLDSDEYAYLDIEVPAGASRLTLVATWDEPPANPTFSQVVENDLDLWLDLGNDCEDASCGEHASESRIDNVEWIIVKDPSPGTYRAKIVPSRMLEDHLPGVALAWTLIRGPSTPEVKLDVTIGAQTEEYQDLEITVTTDGYVASGTRLHFALCKDGFSIEGDCRLRRKLLYGGSFFHDRLDGVVIRKDGIAVPFPNSDREEERSSDYLAEGGPIFLGEIEPLEEVVLHVRLYLETDGEVADSGHYIYVLTDSWNGRSDGPVEVLIPGEEDGSGDSDEPSIDAPPPNDNFDSATLLSGTDGDVEVELFLASAELGEPQSSNDWWAGLGERPIRSVWFQYQPENNKSITLSVDGSEAEFLAVFRGQRLPSLERVGISQKGYTLLTPSESETYWIWIVDTEYTGNPERLHWGELTRPSNDDFANAIVLSSEVPSEESALTAEGTTSGATLEPKEIYPRASVGSVWYQWTAPSSGDWRFTASTALVLVYEGEALDSLRLVSGWINDSQDVRVRSGNTYYISIHASTWEYPSEFELAYSPSPSVEDDENLYWSNDHWADAEALPEASSGLQEVEVGYSLPQTVEPDENAATGVRTTWWSWQPPEGRQHTFHFYNKPWRWAGANPLVLCAWNGSEFDHLSQLGICNDASDDWAMLVDVEEGETYFFSVGFPAETNDALEVHRIATNLRWGPTPQNNSLASALVLSGGNGSATASTSYATLVPGEAASHNALLGSASLWWTYEPEESGWFRFWIDQDQIHTLAVYRTNQGGNLVLLDASVFPRSSSSDGAIQVVFYGEAGVKYTIRVGAIEVDESEFTLSWEGTDRPVWLAYAGQLDYTSDELKSALPAGTTFADLEIGEARDAAYVVSNEGLIVFSRDTDTGDFSHHQTIAPTNGLPIDASLTADPDGRVYALCGTHWWVFEHQSSGLDLTEISHSELEEEDTIECSEGDLEIGGPEDKYLFYAHENVEVYKLDEDSNPEHLESLPHDRDAVDVEVPDYPADATHIYSLSPWRLRVHELVEDEEGSPTIEEITPDDLSSFYSGIGISLPAEEYAEEQESDDYDDNVLVVHDRGDMVTWWERELDPYSLVYQNEIDPLEERLWERCEFTSYRIDQKAIDNVCPNRVYGVEVDEEGGSLETSYVLEGNAADRFNNVVPQWYVVHGADTSEDGRFLYVATKVPSTQRPNIIHFERVDSHTYDIGENGESEENQRAERAHQNYGSLISPRVEHGEVNFGTLQSTDCIDIVDLNLSEANYTVVSSRWQTRLNSAGTWADIPFTRDSGRICAFSSGSQLPEQEYRLVANMLVNGSRHQLTSNVIARIAAPADHGLQGASQATNGDQLQLLGVSNGSLRFGEFETTDGCVRIDNYEDEGKSYRAIRSVWQVWNQEKSAWLDMAHTLRAGSVCNFHAPDSQVYRLKVDMEVDARERQFFSRSFRGTLGLSSEEIPGLYVAVAPGRVSIDGSSHSKCIDLEPSLSTVDVGGASLAFTEWQIWNGLEGRWTGIPKTKRDGIACPISPEDDLIYRLAATFVINGLEKTVSSNTMSTLH